MREVKGAGLSLIGVFSEGHAGHPGALHLENLHHFELRHLAPFGAENWLLRSWGYWTPRRGLGGPQTGTSWPSGAILVFLTSFSETREQRHEGYQLYPTRVRLGCHLQGSYCRSPQGTFRHDVVSMSLLLRVVTIGHTNSKQLTSQGLLRSLKICAAGEGRLFSPSTFPTSW